MMLQDTVDSILMTALNAIMQKKFLEKQIALMPKGTVVMHKKQKAPCPLCTSIQGWQSSCHPSNRRTSSHAVLSILNTPVSCKRVTPDRGISEKCL